MTTVQVLETAFNLRDLKHIVKANEYVVNGMNICLYSNVGIRYREKGRDYETGMNSSILMLTLDARIQLCSARFFSFPSL